MRLGFADLILLTPPLENVNPHRLALARGRVRSSQRRPKMPEITIRLHPDLVDRIPATAPEDAAVLSSLWRQVDRAVRSHSSRIALCANR